MLMYGRSAYEASATQTATPAQLVHMLYDGALTRIEQASVALAAQPADVAAANTALQKAQAIVDELTVTLDRDRGGQIAANLADLYRFCLDQLLEANITKDPAPLVGATSVLTELRDTWAQACLQQATVAGAV